MWILFPSFSKKAARKKVPGKRDVRILINNSSKTIQDRVGCFSCEISHVRKGILKEGAPRPEIDEARKWTLTTSQMKNLSWKMNSRNKDSFLASCFVSSNFPSLQSRSSRFMLLDCVPARGWNRTLWSFYTQPAWNKILHFPHSSPILIILLI